MKITEIKQLKNGRYGLFSLEGYLFSLDEETYVLCGVKTGDELLEDELESLKEQAADKKVRDKAFMLLSYRDHSKQELKKKLLRTTDEETAEATAEKMQQLGLIDDEKYAKTFALELIMRRNFGNIRAIYELTKRGINREDAKAVVESIEDDSFLRAERYLSKKFSRGILNEQTRKRAAAALSRDGFGWEEINKALKNYGMENYDAD
jgi:regulatory protein